MKETGNLSRGERKAFLMASNLGCFREKGMGRGAEGLIA